jgi:hypothetical protein
MSSADDRWAILELIHRSAHAVDAGDFATFAELFARGSFTVGGETLRGRDAVRDHA